MDNPTEIMDLLNEFLTTLRRRQLATPVHAQDQQSISHPVDYILGRQPPNERIQPVPPTQSLHELDTASQPSRSHTTETRRTSPCVSLTTSITSEDSVVSYTIDVDSLFPCTVYEDADETDPLYPYTIRGEHFVSHTIEALDLAAHNDRILHYLGYHRTPGGNLTRQRRLSSTYRKARISVAPWKTKLRRCRFAGHQPLDQPGDDLEWYVCYFHIWNKDRRDDVCQR